MVRPLTPVWTLEVRASETVSARLPAEKAVRPRLAELPAARSDGAETVRFAFVLEATAARSSW